MSFFSFHQVHLDQGQQDIRVEPFHLAVVNLVVQLLVLLHPGQVPVRVLLRVVGAQICGVELVGRVGPGTTIGHDRLCREGVGQVCQGGEPKVDRLNNSQVDEVMHFYIPLSFI